jgi:hypothetical protein
MDGRAALSLDRFLEPAMAQTGLVERIDRQRPQVRCLHDGLSGGLFKGEPGDRSQPAQMVAAPLLN